MRSLVLISALLYEFFNLLTMPCQWNLLQWRINVLQCGNMS